MKKIFLICLMVTLLISGLALVGCTSQVKPVDQTPAADEATPTPEATPEPTPEPSWTMINEVKVDHMTNVEGFLNENFAITVGYSGEIHYSNDGGKTWPRAENASMCRFSLDIVDENLAWSGGNGNQIRVTKDGGKTWSAVTDFYAGGMHSHINFIDDKTGWVAASKKFASTTDGGVTWTEMKLPEGVKSIGAISLRTANDGYFLSLDGQFFTTSDAGQTWNKQQDLGFDKFKIVDINNKIGMLNVSQVPVAEINFTDANNGMVTFIGLVQGEGFKTWAMTTADGGSTWSSEQIILPDDFVATTLFLTKDGKYLTLSTNSKRVLVLKHK